MTHRKHAAALLTAVLLLALTACGRQTAAASDPAPRRSLPTASRTARSFSLRPWTSIRCRARR